MKIDYPFGKPRPDIEVYWRCEAKRYSYVIDADREEYGVTAPRLEMTWWSVKHHTPKGVRLNIGTFILHSAKKKWACATEAEALESFRARKRRQIAILSAKLDLAKRSLALAEEKEASLV